MRYAEDFNYWLTTVHPSKSQGEIMALLENFGIENIQVSQAARDGKAALLVRFHWNGKPYRFTFVPMLCRNPKRIVKFGGKSRPATEQARYQMGRIAVYFIKAILTAAEVQPDALFGFLEIPTVINDEGLPLTMAEIDLNLYKAIPANLNDDMIDGEVKNING
jgi:hypothetical protein